MKHVSIFMYKEQEREREREGRGDSKVEIIERAILWIFQEFFTFLYFKS